MLAQPYLQEPSWWAGPGPWVLAFSIWILYLGPVFFAIKDAIDRPRWAWERSNQARGTWIAITVLLGLLGVLLYHLLAKPKLEKAQRDEEREKPASASRPRKQGPAVRRPRPGPTRRPAPVERRRAGMKLTVRSGPDEGKTVHVTDEPAIIGRDPTCDLVLSDPTVSRRHASVHLGPDGRAVYQDLGSTAGTMIDGNEIVEAVALEGREELRLGDTVLSVSARRD